MSTVCSKLDELAIRRIADEKFNLAAKCIAPMMTLAVTQFADEIEPILDQAILLDPQNEEEMVKTVHCIMSNSIKAAFNKIFEESENNA